MVEVHIVRIGIDLVIDVLVELFLAVGEVFPLFFGDVVRCVALSFQCCAVRGGTCIQGGACGDVVGCALACVVVLRRCLGC